jgi:oligoribonuclease (3'-5' exoribonuclease)
VLIYVKIFCVQKIVYLRRFKKLKTINLGGNPVCQLEEYKTFVIAHLPVLNYLDYRLVDPNAVSMELTK